MSITAAQVKELRERTGAGMMECKKALVETSGDMEAAIEHLRKSGLGQRPTRRPLAWPPKARSLTPPAISAAWLVEIKQRNPISWPKDSNFRGFAEEVAQLALENDDVESLAPGPVWPVGQQRRRRAPAVGRQGPVRMFRSAVLAKMEAGDGVVRPQLHPFGVRIGVMVGLKGGDESLARDIAMHIAALNPAFFVTSRTFRPM